MKPSKPRLWLRGDWNALAPAQNDGALAGDLLEAYNRRRSAAWYWRQVLIGTETSCASEMPHHRRRSNSGGCNHLGGWLRSCRARSTAGSRVFHARRLSAWACFVRHQPSRRPLEWVDRSITQPQASQRRALDQRRNLAQRGLLEWGSLEQNFIFGIVYYLVAVPGFTIGGFLFTRLPKTPRRRKTPGLKRSLH